MAFRLDIALGNEAMRTRGHVAMALATLAATGVLERENDGAIRDLNGNTVGHWEFTEAPAEEAL